MTCCVKGELMIHAKLSQRKLCDAENETIQIPPYHLQLCLKTGQALAKVTLQLTGTEWTAHSSE